MDEEHGSPLFSSHNADFDYIQILCFCEEASTPWLLRKK